MLKKINKYSYITVPRSENHGTRTYDVHGHNLPSVTTILSRTKDHKRGTSMHKYLEHYVLGKGYEDLTELGQQTKKMANKVIEVGLTPVEGYYGSEITLYYPGLYAGTTDLVCMHNDMETIVDFKQSNRPKRKEWIEDYYLQIAAYAMAHDYVHGSQIEQGIIMVCTPDLYYQEFVVNGAELRQAKHKFLKRLDMYHDLIFDEKEKANVKITEEDFNAG